MCHAYILWTFTSEIEIVESFLKKHACLTKCGYDCKSSIHKAGCMSISFRKLCWMFRNFENVYTEHNKDIDIVDGKYQIWRYGCTHTTYPRIV